MASYIERTICSWSGPCEAYWRRRHTNNWSDRWIQDVPGRNPMFRPTDSDIEKVSELLVDNSLIWNRAKLEASASSSNGPEQRFWKKVWKVQTPSKVRTFWLREISNCICLSEANFHRRHKVTMILQPGMRCCSVLWHYFKEMFGTKIPNLHSNS